MSEELKPCPFCGGNKIDCWQPNTTTMVRNWWQAKCLLCGSKSSFADTKLLAIKAWNTRANEPSKHEQALLDVLRNKLCDAVDENDHPADQRNNLVCELERLVSSDLFDAYEGALEGFVCADKYNLKCK